MTPLFIAATIQFLIPVFGVSTWFALTRANGVHGRAIAALLTVWFAIAAAFAFMPSLAAWRQDNAAVQPAFILSTIAIAAALHAVPSVRDFFRGASLTPLLALFLWRAVFGFLLAMLWLAGGLPTAFALPAAIGDMTVGLWAGLLLWRMRRGDQPSRLHLWLWNLVGLLDLLNVMRLAVTVVVPWLAANPALPEFPLLPLFGVPLFIALHLHMWRAWQR
ncbi:MULTISPECIES: hypothetical protein [unclassified Bosea (in: a-proteobacteria)]|uniref:hypothetical protein n=1 Tax=unclassified Bosea (in: a-proteobacteria) TaxID=2653178 RepID=UPI000F755A8A|nr:MULTISPECIES: hypothetical protein [unclassified Bosea (in: a-proteobacteria)]AZO80196.1 hypothetical protein BLM15_23380 [Bosea sp. Tri-49]RXT22989.1 hypothetical protein B5U98_10170 [Bosea sp. Tri-39]RXT38459.1 hypothetical protein B5U99_09620 [Bosea sp. Tri-54]